MSLEAARGFVERVKTDEDFRTKINDCKDRDVRIAFIKQAGYEFSGEDIELLKAELTEGDLDGVAGGANASCAYYRDMVETG